MKRIYHFIAAVLVTLLPLASCNKVTPDVGGDDVETPEVVAPTVTLTAGEASDNSLTFVLTPKDAQAARYAVYQAGEALPTVEELMTPASGKAGTPADPTVADTYTVTGLEYATEYTVVAAASNSAGYSELVTLNMTTAVPVPAVTLSLVSVSYDRVEFKLSTLNASKAAYVVLEESENVPTAANVIVNGTEVDAAEATYVAAGLASSTSYKVVAAALDVNGGNPVLSEALSFTTEERVFVAPSIGDFYYSDGTWGAELDAAKEPIGIVFYIGAATEFGDSQSYYKVKDGSSPMGEIHGYAIALNDADPEFVNQYDVVEDGVWWSFWDGSASPTGVSIEVDDFLGYTNTIAIQQNCIMLKKEFANSEDSYPAAYCATRGYEEVCPAPAQSSGWFLPSAYQLQYIWDQVYFNNSGNLKGWLENSFSALGDKATPLYRADAEYWSSTEVIDSSAHTYRAYYVSFDERQFQAGFVAWYNKNYQMDVRSVLVF